MKKFILLISLLFCTFFGANAQDTIPTNRSICVGQSTTWTIPISIATNTDTCICSHNGLFDTIVGRTFTLHTNETTKYILISVNLLSSGTKIVSTSSFLSGNGKTKHSKYSYFSSQSSQLFPSR